ncbi:MAG: hypothetical protein ACKV2T_17030 [Kofleriaceae bacterium]
MRSTILLLVAVAYPAVADAGPCAIQALSPHPLVQAAIAPGGGVIVGLLRGGFGKESASSAIDKAWRFRDVNTLVEPSRTSRRVSPCTRYRRPSRRMDPRRDPRR